MNAHHFVNGVKVQRFCCTLLREAGLYFQSLETLDNVTWLELQNLFRQRYFGNWVIHENNYFMHGDHLVSMKTQKP